MIERYSDPDIKNIFDRKWNYMLQVEQAVAEAQAEVGLIPKKAAEDIALLSVNKDRIIELEKETKHDIEAFVRSLSEQISKNGKYVHYMCTSSDIIDTANALMIKDLCSILFSKCSILSKCFVKNIHKYKDLKMIGRTHGMPAALITLGHKFYGYLYQLNRDTKRIYDSRTELLYGKIRGPVGYISNIDAMKVEDIVLYKLNLQLEEHVTQVIPRDKYASLISNLAIYACNLERLALEIRLLHRPEVGELQEGFSDGQIGSSAMPHKKNPIKCEQISGLTRMMKSFVGPALDDIGLWHERDISHSSVERFIIPQAFHLACYITDSMIDILENLIINEENIKNNIKKFEKELQSSKLLSEKILESETREEAYQKVRDELKF